MAAVEMAAATMVEVRVEGGGGGGGGVNSRGWVNSMHSRPIAASES